MEVKTFKNSEEAIWSFVKNHRGYHLYPHKFETRGEAEFHYHRKAQEWLIVSQGKFILWLGDENRTFDLKKDQGAIVIHLPRGKKHALMALSKIKYFVIRDKKDQNIYCWKGVKNAKDKN